MIYLIIYILLTLLSQVILKFESKKNYKQQTGSYLKKMLLNYRVIIAYGISFLNVLVWILALRKNTLFTSVLFTSLIYVLILFADKLFFRDPIDLKKIIGASFIVLGVLLSV